VDKEWWGGVVEGEWISQTVIIKPPPSITPLLSPPSWPPPIRRISFKKNLNRKNLRKS
jgi:hypothetical protein